MLPYLSHTRPSQQQSLLNQAVAVPNDCVTGVLLVTAGVLQLLAVLREEKVLELWVPEALTPYTWKHINWYHPGNRDRRGCVQ
jgi:hypothetical protein